MTIHLSDSPAAASRRLLSQDEIDAIAECRGDSVWIRNLQSAGDHDLVDAMFNHHSSHSLNDINSAYHVVVDTHGECRAENLSSELLEAVATIAHDLYEATKDSSCERWGPEDYRPLLKHFTANLTEWDIALATIRMRHINNYEQLMGLMPQVMECEDTPALYSGVL